jgi:hypothetical protein
MALACAMIVGGGLLNSATSASANPYSYYGPEWGEARARFLQVWNSWTQEQQAAYELIEDQESKYFWQSGNRGPIPATEENISKMMETLGLGQEYRQFVRAVMTVNFLPTNVFVYKDVVHGPGLSPSKDEYDHRIRRLYRDVYHQEHVIIDPDSVQNIAWIAVMIGADPADIDFVVLASRQAAWMTQRGEDRTNQLIRHTAPARVVRMNMDNLTQEQSEAVDTCVSNLKDRSAFLR